MIRGRRVFLDDLVEQYLSGRSNLPRYAVYHKDQLVDGPFTVYAAGRNKIVVISDKDGQQRSLFVGDAGLAPYGGVKWNETNATYEMLPDLAWQDDWM